MSTTLFNSYVGVSKDIGDYWAGTTTAAGTVTTLVDSSLMSKNNDWVGDYSWVILTSEPTGSASIYDERKVTSLDNTTGTLTTLAFPAVAGSAVTYDLNRLFAPSDIKLALIQAAKLSFPALHNKVWNEAKRAGNWLKDGSMEIWTSSSALTNWTVDTSTVTKSSSVDRFIHGSYAAGLSNAAGYVGQSITNNDDLKLLRGQSVTFVGQGWSDTPTSLRLAIWDGTNLTYSSYHPGNSAWSTPDNTWFVQAEIPATATEIAFRVYHDQATAVDVIDDCYVIGPFYPKVYINDLGLAQSYPLKIGYFPLEKQMIEPLPIRDYDIDTDWIYLKDDYRGMRLRIEGMGYLDYLASGVASTAWTATINVDEPQLKILTAQAAVWLYQQMALPNFSSGTRKDFADSKMFWEQELAKRKAVFGMKTPPARACWGIE